MADSDIRGYVSRRSLQGVAEGLWGNVSINKMGNLVVVPFLAQMALDQRIFQVRLGTISTPLEGDIAVTDTKAEASAEAAAGMTIIPVKLNAIMESINGGTLPEIWAKSQAAVSTSGTVFVPLPLYTGGVAAAAVCRVAAAGGVVVAAETVTTVRVHYGNMLTAQGDSILADHYFLETPTLAGPSCFYVQIAGTTAGPTYFANFDFIELPTVAIT